MTGTGGGGAGPLLSAPGSSLRDRGLRPGLRVSRGQVPQRKCPEDSLEPRPSRVQARRRQHEQQEQDQGGGTSGRPRRLSSRGPSWGDPEAAVVSERSVASSPAAQPRLLTARASPAPLVPPVLPAASARPQPPAPSPGDCLSRVRPAAAARARPLLPR